MRHVICYEDQAKPLEWEIKHFSTKKKKKGGTTVGGFGEQGGRAWQGGRRKPKKKTQSQSLSGIKQSQQWDLCRCGRGEYEETENPEKEV